MSTDQTTQYGSTAYSNHGWAGISLLLLAATCYSLTSPLARWVGGSFAPFYQSWTRCLISLVVFVPLGLLRGGFHQARSSSDARWLLGVGLAKAIGYVPFYVAANHMPIANVMFIFYASSVITGYLISRLFFAERLSAVKLTSLILAMLGLVCILSIRLSDIKFWYTLLAALAGSSFSLYGLLSKKISGRYSAIQINTIGLVLEMMASLVLYLLLDEAPYTDWLSRDWMINLVFCLVMMGAMTFAVLGFRQVEAQRGSLVMLLELVLVTIWGYVFFAETPSALALVGSMCIIVGMVLPNIQPSEQGASHGST